MSFDSLQDKILALKNPTVTGLDPRPDYIPPDIVTRCIREHGETLTALADAYFEFNRGLIDALCDIVPAVKPQSACYERLGPDGVAAFQKTAAYARERGMYVIADVKRGDIGSTAEDYAEGYLGDVTVGGAVLRPFDVDAVTVHAYLGADGITPFLNVCRREDKAIFVLVKTSNPSGGQYQDLTVDGKTLFETVGDDMQALAADTVGQHGFTCAGAVVGATYPEQLTALRRRLQSTFFLVPGYGAQGGGASDVAGAFDAQGRGAVINSSRGIICAWKKTGNAGADYAEAARSEAVKMRDALRAVIPLG